MSVFTRPCGSEGCRKKHWHYAFSIRNVRYRGSIPEARTKHEAEQAETKLRSDVFEGRFGRPTGSQDFVRFVEEVYLTWARENKRSWKHDEFHAATICASRQFKGKTFARITAMQVEKFKQERRGTKTRRGTDRSAAPVNRD
ncbi:MAG TPA: hypothetical protein VF297_17400 [Pyrinomonadaceae bacterium]